jgi:hypothetical protein
MARASKRALELAAGEVAHLGKGQMGDAGFGQRRVLFGAGQRIGQRHEAVDRQRQRPVDGDLLRHVADAQTRDAHALPSLGAMMPSAMRAVVDLPEPFGPISVTISPRWTSRSMSRTSQRPERSTPGLFQAHQRLRCLQHVVSLFSQRFGPA